MLSWRNCFPFKEMALYHFTAHYFLHFYKEICLPHPSARWVWIRSFSLLSQMFLHTYGLATDKQPWMAFKMFRFGETWNHLKTMFLSLIVGTVGKHQDLNISARKKRTSSPLMKAKFYTQAKFSKNSWFLEDPRNPFVLPQKFFWSPVQHPYFSPIEPFLGKD